MRSSQVLEQTYDNPSETVAAGWIFFNLREKIKIFALSAAMENGLGKEYDPDDEAGSMGEE